ncbi:DUF2252 domain-containing protein [Nigerium massiliense]|uniref:DUF2252 domain-containing protein n=1 Tax=Nigerium massiliense TaxID=1522317 RepID=UPI000590BA5F|nr:DUF2252 domain-containing protein [Nigerium massiliense]
MSRSVQHTVLATTNSESFRSLTAPTTTREERYRLGRDLREIVPVKSLGTWKATSHRRSPVDLIEESHTGRIPELIPIRVGRMVSSPYGFLRGAAVVQAADSAFLPSTGITPISCGDSHLGNFGFYRSPEGEQVIDLNDFDEAHPGPWEWDVRRLTASVYVAGRENGYKEDECADAVRTCVHAYRDEMVFLADQPLFARSFNRLDTDRLSETVTEKGLRQEMKRALKQARKRTSDRALPKFTDETENGERRIIEDRPLITRLSEAEYNAVATALDNYLDTLAPHWRRVVGGYTLVDIAHKVVGVGSVGLRAYVALLEGSSPEDVLFLQLKQARRSVLARYVHGEAALHEHQGQRVVEYQQALQTVSDPLLGWTSVELPEGTPLQSADGTVSTQPTRMDLYVRQFRNMKGTVPLDNISAEGLTDYAGIVGHLLAKGHARTSGASMVAGYLGKANAAADAFARFARLYADQTEADHAEFLAAAKSGRLPIEPSALENMGSAFRPGG